MSSNITFTNRLTCEGLYSMKLDLSQTYKTFWNNFCIDSWSSERSLRRQRIKAILAAKSKWREVTTNFIYSRQNWYIFPFLNMLSNIIILMHWEGCSLLGQTKAWLLKFHHSLSSVRRMNFSNNTLLLPNYVTLIIQMMMMMKNVYSIFKKYFAILIMSKPTHRIGSWD